MLHEHRSFFGFRRDTEKVTAENPAEGEIREESVESHKCSAKTAVEDSERIFTELIHSIEKIHSEMTQ
ncbi:hypothetical protein QQF64_033701 [Cirrhinus molitorella]|uniref:TRIM8/14/16/25/29/45/65 coiled-coil region domain-containing protein n=1 Tax=Cirrhinus molitorella TaxID=172907 RepID=A0ABR3MUN0_9TELE